MVCHLRFRGPAGPVRRSRGTSRLRAPRGRCRIVVIRGSHPGAYGAHTCITMTKPSAPRRHLSTSPFKAPVVPVAKHFALGDRVTHDQFGLGRIVGVEEGIAMLVDFGSRQARIVSPYTRMDKL